MRADDWRVDPSLERKSLSVRLAESIESSLKAREWGDVLPGHRTLMARYAVSAKTCLAAIQLLEARGLIAAGEKGKRRRILTGARGTPENRTDLLILHSQTTPSGDDQRIMQAYRGAWEEAGGRVHLARFDFPRYRHPAVLLQETIARHRADALLLYVAPEAWVEESARQRPVFLSGGEWRGPPITGVGFNISHEITRAVVQLRECGHRRIAVPCQRVGQLMEDSLRQGVAAALGLPADSPEVRQLCPVFAEQVPAAYQRYWEKLFLEVHPTAVVLLQDIHVMSLYGYCFRRGIRIPRDLSVLCLEDNGHLEWCEPTPNRMRFPLRNAVAYFRKWIRGGCLPMGMKFLQLKALEGGSIASLR